MWVSVHFTDRNNNVVLMNIIYDTIQFVVVVSVSDKTSATLADHFMQHIFLKFGIYHLVMLDDGSPLEQIIFFHV